MNPLSKIAAASVLAVSIFSSNAGTLVLDFEGIANATAIGSFYNGVGGPDYNITFGPNALALVDSDAGGGGNFGHEPSPETIMFFLTGSAVLNVPDGFDTGFSFFYSSPFATGNVNVWSGMNGTGTLLGSFPLGTTPQDGGDPNGSYSPFVPIGIEFEGIAMSVDFQGAANNIGFDNITFGDSVPEGAESPVPEPSTVIGGITLAGLAASKMLRRKKA